MTPHARTLRDRLAAGDIVLAPGAADALTARLVARSGFGAVYMTGLGATAARLGAPDLGLMSQTEMSAQARAMVHAARCPVIADADTGYGGPLNLRRVIEDYAQAGVAAFHVEDQQSPKRCGQLSGARLVSVAEAEARLRAARAACDATGSGMLLIGRTDALGPEGMDAALDRARRYADCGADLVFVDGIRTAAQVQAVAAAIPGPKVVSIVDGTEAVSLSAQDLQQMGFGICLYALTTLFAGLGAQAAALAHLARKGTPAGLTGGFDYAGFSDLVGLQEHQEFAHAYEV